MKRKYLKKLIIKSSAPRILFVLFVLQLLRIKRYFHNQSPHWVGSRGPKALYFNLYTYILFTVMATVILIATQDIQRGILLFGAFIIPLYGMIRVAHTFAKRLQAIKPERIQVP